MSWITEPKRTWTEWAAIRLLKVGPIPRHVAFIMDGNRRFAQQLHKETLDGHTEGFKKLTEVLSWCRDLSINEVTVYAFSIENFKRSKTEVNGLMQLAEDKFAQLLDEKDRLNESGICIRVFGKLDLLTPKLQSLVAKAIINTKGNKKCFLNLALAYTSREEIINAISEVKNGVINSIIDVSDINEALIEESLYTGGFRHPDLLIRTSGETRLSDFLLWQSAMTHLFFTKVLWPQISIWHLLAAVFHYQRHHHTLINLQADVRSQSIYKEEVIDIENWTKRGKKENFKEFVKRRRNRAKNFIDQLREQRYQTMLLLSQSF